jgi:membrane-bound lytic murein transglycosylase A
MLDVPIRQGVRALALTLLLALSSCVTPPPRVEVTAAEQPRYERVSWRALPGWSEDSLTDAWAAFRAGCGPLQQRAEWRELCASAQSVPLADTAAHRRFFEARFDVVKVVSDTAGSTRDTGLVTGYYEPLVQGSRRRVGPYQTPLYAVPDDLLTIDLSSLYPELAGKRLRGRVVGNKVVPYYSRAEIDRAPSVRGKELVWVSDPVDAFFLQVQGSGRVQLDTGETLRLQYADVNGHPYRSIGRYLVDQGELTLETASAQRIREWVREHPERAVEVLNANPSVVFFTAAPLRDAREGPKGALGVPLTAGRSLAVDPRYIPLGTPVFVATTDPLTQTPMRRLMMAQDTGGAIKGVLRGDWYFGFGESAAAQAGRMRNQGSFWLLWPKGVPLPQSSTG